MKTSMHILMICPQFRPIVGGYERAAERLSAALASKEHTVTIITERRCLSWKAREEQDCVQIRRLWCLYRAHLHLVSSLVSFGLFLLTHGRKFQVWHVHQYGLHAGLAVALGKILCRPVLMKLTNSGKGGLEYVTSALPLAGVAQFLLHKVNAVVALTRETQVEAVSFGIPASRVHIVGNGIDINHFEIRSKEKRACNRNIIGSEVLGMVIFVGRLVEHKNVNGLLLAWKIACANLPDGWKLIVLGEGAMRKQLETFSKDEGLATSVIFAGEQSNVAEWMAASDFLVVPSHWEGLSNTMLEAMSTGLPVVSTRVSGSTETLEETGAGIVVDIGNIEQLANAVPQLASDAILRCKMGKIGRAFIEKNYSIEIVAERHEQLYRSLISQR